MEINPSNSNAAVGTAGAVKSEAGSLGKDDFLKILVGQMQNMDPMAQSQDSGQMIQQMTQFSMLEQITNMARANERTQSVAMLGKTVSYKAKDGTLTTGEVEKVELKDGSVKLTVAGQSGIALSSVSEVR
jgi:flagellar basal-body rod modification protein FlgD